MATIYCTFEVTVKVTTAGDADSARALASLITAAYNSTQLDAKDTSTAINNYLTNRLHQPVAVVVARRLDYWQAEPVADVKNKPIDDPHWII